jgi:hypothetical protein
MSLEWNYPYISYSILRASIDSLGWYGREEITYSQLELPVTIKAIASPLAEHGQLKQQLLTQRISCTETNAHL